MCWFCRKRMNWRDAFLLLAWERARARCVCEIRNSVLRHSVDALFALLVSHPNADCSNIVRCLSCIGDTIQMNVILALAFAHKHTGSIVQQSFKLIQMFVSAQPKKRDVKTTAKKRGSPLFSANEHSAQAHRRLPLQVLTSISMTNWAVWKRAIASRWPCIRGTEWKKKKNAETDARTIWFLFNFHVIRFSPLLFLVFSTPLPNISIHDEYIRSFQSLHSICLIKTANKSVWLIRTRNISNSDKIERKKKIEAKSARNLFSVQLLRKSLAMPALESR